MEIWGLLGERTQHARLIGRPRATAREHQRQIIVCRHAPKLTEGSGKRQSWFSGASTHYFHIHDIRRPRGGTRDPRITVRRTRRPARQHIGHTGRGSLERSHECGALRGPTRAPAGETRAPHRRAWSPARGRVTTPQPTPKSRDGNRAPHCIGLRSPETAQTTQEDQAFKGGARTSSRR